MKNKIKPKSKSLKIGCVGRWVSRWGGMSSESWDIFWIHNIEITGRLVGRLFCSGLLIFDVDWALWSGQWPCTSPTVRTRFCNSRQETLCLWWTGRWVRKLLLNWKLEVLIKILMYIPKESSTPRAGCVTWRCAFCQLTSSSVTSCSSIPQPWHGLTSRAAFAECPQPREIAMALPRWTARCTYSEATLRLPFMELRQVLPIPALPQLNRSSLRNRHSFYWFCKRSIILYLDWMRFLKPANNSGYYIFTFRLNVKPERHPYDWK